MHQLAPVMALRSLLLLTSWLYAKAKLSHTCWRNKQQAPSYEPVLDSIRTLGNGPELSQHILFEMDFHGISIELDR